MVAYDYSASVPTDLFSVPCVSCYFHGFCTHMETTGKIPRHGFFNQRIPPHKTTYRSCYVIHLSLEHIFSHFVDSIRENIFLGKEQPTRCTVASDVTYPRWVSLFV